MSAAEIPGAAYRPDIDGLRAVSVLAVILFHSGFGVASGGYVGVDVFFVISGFLITRLLLEKPGISIGARLREFYLRRGRRILPALFVVIWASALAAWVLFSPRELTGFGRFVAACAAMLANIPAWHAGGYFDTPWAATPLLHLWSIAVEEQFYVFFPLALLFVQRRLPANWRVPVIGAAAATSLALCVWASYTHPAANYYAAPTRAWELLAGALLALGAVPRPASRLLAESLAVLALLAIVAACAWYDSRTRYPGIFTLVPAIATAILIVTGSGRPAGVNRLLSFGPLVFIGLISYSLYLWHVPVLTLFGYFNIVPANFPQKLGLLALIAGLAIASWAWVERPVRSRRFLHGNSGFAWTAVVCSVGTIAGGLVLAHSDGYPRRFPQEVQRILDNDRLFGVSGTGCMGLTPASIDADALCSSGASGVTRATVMLWGDSHAWALLPAVEQIAASRDARLLFAAWPGCRPLPGVDNELLPGSSQARCADFNAAMLRAVRRLRPDVLVLHAQWMHGATPGVRAGEVERGLRDLAREAGSAVRAICVVQGVPRYPFSVPNALAVAHMRGLDPGFYVLTRAEVMRQQSAVDEPIRASAADGLLRAVDPKLVFCGERGSCRYRGDDGLPYYRDDNHLSVSGALLLAPSLDTCVR